MDSTPKICKGCPNRIVISNPSARNVKFCTRECREKFYDRTLTCRTKEYRDFKNHEKWNKPGPGKIQCKVCGGWYRAVLHHVWQRHGATEREYKEEFGLDHKKSLIHPELKAIKREAVFSNGTIENLKSGKKTRFIKGDSRAGRYKRSAQTMERLRKHIKKISKVT